MSADDRHDACKKSPVVNIKRTQCSTGPVLTHIAASSGANVVVFYIHSNQPNADIQLGNGDFLFLSTCVAGAYMHCGETLVAWRILCVLCICVVIGLVHTLRSEVEHKTL